MKRLSIAILLLTLAGGAQAYDSCSCVSYARERSGISTHRVGSNGTAYEWYKKADNAGDTSSSPKKGRVMILRPNQNGIGGAGHALYVESAKKTSGDNYDVDVSHVNYNNKCAGPETNKRVRYYKDRKSVKFKQGVWTDRTFQVAGFIER